MFPATPKTAHGEQNRRRRSLALTDQHRALRSGGVVATDVERRVIRELTPCGVAMPSESDVVGAVRGELTLAANFVQPAGAGDGANRNQRVLARRHGEEPVGAR